ncbi:sec-independent protein translocase protein TatB [Crenobacter luteus]|uniref:Sec-independent protein translocase protein TatB n=1 Tax=Crenobacter luteus TaxID=1452487 RepID=UPI0010F1CA3A|nr:Sec-independent protein translocase protein TatB [Crenobacter luteus]TCP13598.1 sec-independent protein translocase protein TatB [Crenobacter luteus]
MFEISFGELLLIGVVALVVLGPERLPAVARTAGALLGRLQRFVASVKSDIHRETEAAGLIGLKGELQDAAQVFQQRLEAEMREVREASAQVEREIAAARGAPDAADLAVVEAAEEARQAALFAAAPDAPAPHPAAEVDENQLDLFGDSDPPAKSSRA